MTWTTEKPTKNGLYWLRPNGWPNIHQIRVLEEDDPLRDLQEDIAYHQWQAEYHDQIGL